MRILVVEDQKELNEIIVRKYRNLTAGILAGALTMTMLTACSGAGQVQQEQQADMIVSPQTAEATAPLLYEENAAPADTGADVCELEREYDDGRLEYEGSIYYGGYEYDFEIDGATGKIFGKDVDRMDYGYPDYYYD